MRGVVIGLGRMGLRHLQVAKAEGIDIVGVADRRPEAVQQAREAGVAADALFDDAESMLRKTRPELVIVATTAPSHARLTCLAAELGAAAVLCEKPMAVSLAECDRMIAACRRSGTRLAVNHQMRFMEQYTAPKALLASEALGGLSSVTVVAGNFGMGMNGTHYFEMFRFMTGEAPARVAAWFSAGKLANPRGAEFEDRAGSIRLETLSGKRFFMDAAADQGHGMLVCYAAPHGRITVDELGGRMWVVARKPEHRAQPTTRYGMPWDEEERRIAPADALEPTRAVLRALLDGTDYPDGAAGRLAVEILVAAYVSDEAGGRTIDLGREALPRERVFPWA